MSERRGAGSRISALADGLVRGVEIAGPCELELADDQLTVVHQAPGGQGRLTVPYDLVDGVRLAADGRALEIFLAGGDALELTGSDRLPAASREIARRACSLPELTRPLRALGSHRGRPGAEHDRFFGPLLAAKRETERTDLPQRRIAAFDGAALRLAAERALAEIAAERYPQSAPDRRALEAELGELAAPLFAALDRVPAAARRARDADDETKFARWREWMVLVHACFEAADRAWLALMPALAPQGQPPKRRFWRRWFGRGAAGVVAACALAAIPVQPAHAQRSVRSTWEVSGVRPESLLARGLDVVEVRNGRALVVANDEDLATLRSIGTVERELPTPRAQRMRTMGPAALEATSVYRPFDGARSIRQYLDSIVSANPRVHLDTLGFSHEGRPILAAKIGDANDDPARPNVLYMATYHAREWAATEMALRLVRHLASPPAPSARVDSLVAARDVWIVPVVNPDGYQFTFDGDRLWRKNRRPSFPGIGVDLNRNHEAHWGADDAGSSPSPGSEVYRGPSPASELETQAVQAFHAAHPPVASISFHSYTGVVLYPPGWRFGLLPGDLGIYRALAGTDVRPAVRDLLPGSERTWYRPAPSWNLYPTNGDYNDWAYAEHGTLSFTPELSSGWENGVYYGFEFPDDETRLQQLFEDNLPFALDVLEAARDPLDWRSPTTGMRAERLMLESVAPVVRARVPAAATPELLVSGNPLAFTTDTTGYGTFTRRIVSAPSLVRPRAVTLRAGALARRYEVLAASGAEPGESGWTANGFAAFAQSPVAGGHAWATAAAPGASVSALRSPPMSVPADADTVSVLFWNFYAGDGFALVPHGEVRVSTNGGATWSLAGRVSGAAHAYYTEQVTVSGVAGRTIQVEFFTPNALAWTLDEIAVVAHRPAGAEPPLATRLSPSANPVRDARVSFAWPFETEGELLVYDFAGRLVQRLPVTGGEATATWDVAASGARNGAYVVVARSGGRTQRVTLFVARNGG